MKYTWSFQKLEFFTDHAAEMGGVSFDDAIKVFQEFPWDGQLKKIEDRRMTFTLPNINFKNESGTRELKISKINYEEFEVCYVEGSAEATLLITNNYNLNPQGYIVEEIIERFFQNNLNEIVNLKSTIDLDQEEEINSLEFDTIISTVEQEIKTLEFDIANSKKLTFTLGTLIGFAVHFIYILRMGYGALGDSSLVTIILFNLLFLLLWLPGTILSLSYKLENAKARLTIDVISKKASYIDKSKKIDFSRDDIEFCQFNYTKNSFSHYTHLDNFNFLRIDLKNGESLIITSLLADAQTIINALKLHVYYKECSVAYLEKRSR